MNTVHGEADTEQRPLVWTGHIGPVPVPDIDEAAAFYLAIGCRPVARLAGLAIFELRGGTHLIVQTGEPEQGATSPFDLRVEDLDTTRDRYEAAALKPTQIRQGHQHCYFTIVDAGGRIITVDDSHVIGAV
jgi:catechol 2,3-dioxygenase-like lactoylglutathione lyase family enzyme